MQLEVGLQWVEQEVLIHHADSIRRTDVRALLQMEQFSSGVAPHVALHWILQEVESGQHLLSGADDDLSNYRTVLRTGR